MATIKVQIVSQGGEVRVVTMQPGEVYCYSTCYKVQNPGQPSTLFAIQAWVRANEDGTTTYGLGEPLLPARGPEAVAFVRTDTVSEHRWPRNTARELLGVKSLESAEGPKNDAPDESRVFGIDKVRVVGMSADDIPLGEFDNCDPRLVSRILNGRPIPLECKCDIVRGGCTCGVMEWEQAQKKEVNDEQAPV